MRKDIRRLMMIERIVPRVWMCRRRWTPTLGVRRKQCTAQERLANMRRWKCQLSILTLVRRTHEERYKEAYDDRAYRAKGLDVPTKVDANSRSEKKAMHGTGE